MGSAATLPLALLLRPLPHYAFAAVAVGVSILGVWVSGIAADVLGEKDPQSVVIDEVAGVLLALSFVHTNGLFAWALAWLLFRLFDITKPGPIDRAQYLSPPGLGIMADDILAGLVAGGVTLAVTRFVPALA